MDLPTNPTLARRVIGWATPYRTTAGKTQQLTRWGFVRAARPDPWGSSLIYTVQCVHTGAVWNVPQRAVHTVMPEAN